MHLLSLSKYLPLKKTFSNVEYYQVENADLIYTQVSVNYKLVNIHLKRDIWTFGSGNNVMILTEFRLYSKIIIAELWVSKNQPLFLSYTWFNTNLYCLGKKGLRHKSVTLPLLKALPMICIHSCVCLNAHCLVLTAGVFFSASWTFLWFKMCYS